MSSSEAHQFSALDEPQEWAAFSHLNEAQGAGKTQWQSPVWQSHIVVQGMHCAACAGRVRGALLGVPGVLQAQVNAATGQTSVVWREGATRPSQWLGALHGAGYPAQPVHDLQGLLAQRKAQRMALWRWLVAGLCMMQVMMYALPAYVALPGEMTADAQALLRWASWVLTLPVLVFSCGPFFASAWRDLRLRRVGMDVPVALGIAITFAISSAGTFDPTSAWGEAVYFDSLTMFVFFLLTGRWLEQVLKGRTVGALQALSQRLPFEAERRSAEAMGADLNVGVWERVSVRRLAPGDRLRVLPGDAFAADGVIERGETQVDEALLTGEATPCARGPGGAVLAGSFNLTAVVEMTVQSLGDQTRFAHIVALMDSAATQKARLAQLADRVAGPFLVCVLIAAALGGLYHAHMDPAHDVARAWMVAVAVLVVTCPCALSIATPAAMLAAAGALARSGVLVRRLQALEALSQVDTVVFDKTGTLTTGHMALQETRVREGVMPEEALAMAAALAAHSLHPVSRALVTAGPTEMGWVVSDASEQSGAGLTGVCVGRASPPRRVRLGSAAWCGVEDTQGPTALNAPGRVVYLSDEDDWLATFVLAEELRDDAAATVAALRARGVAVHLLSGDHPAAAEKVASLVGMTDAQGGCMPDAKLRQLQALQAKGCKVAMVGDGLNDGPALAAAAVSFAMGGGVPLAQAQSDFVVQGQHLMAVVGAMVHAQRCMRVVRQNLVWALGYNLVAIPLAVSGGMTAWLAGLGMALSSLLVVANAARLSRGFPS